MRYYLYCTLAFTLACSSGCTPKVKPEVIKDEAAPVSKPHLKMVFHKKEMLVGPHRKEQFCHFEVEDEGNTPIYKIVRHTISDKMECIGSFVRNEKNLLCWADKPDELYLVNFYGFFPGEPIDYYLVAINDQRVFKLHIIPTPMQVIKTNGYTLAAELLTPDGYSFLFHGSGFEPNEVVNCIAATDGQEEGFNLKTDEEGKLSFTINPAWTDERGGSAEVELYGSKGYVAMTYPWGTAYMDWAESLLNEKTQQ